VTQKLTEVRGAIEKQEAQFNTMSHQIETVAIAISLRTQDEEQVFGLNWHPLYELKLAAADGLREVVNYGHGHGVNSFQSASPAPVGGNTLPGGRVWLANGAVDTAALVAVDDCARSGAGMTM